MSSSLGTIYQSVFHSLLHGVVVIDDGGIIVTCNSAIYNILGYPPEMLEGKNVSVLMAGKDATNHNNYIEKFIATGQSGVIGLGREVEGLHRDGRYIPLELSVSECYDGHGRYFIGVLSDITARKQGEQRLRTGQKVMRAVNGSLGDFINSNVSIHELFDGLLDKLLDISNSEFGFLGEIMYGDDGVPFLKSYAISNIAWSAETHNLYRDNKLKGFEFRNLNTLFGATIRSGDFVISNDPTSDPRSGGLPSGHPSLKRYLGMPIYSGNKFVGMAGVANCVVDYDEDLIEVLRPMLSTIGMILASHQNNIVRRKAEEKLYLTQQKLREMATVDGLTKVNNRRNALLLLEEMFQGHVENNRVLSVLFLDVDYFKQVNDKYGHSIGDVVLEGVASVISATLRPSDLVGRYGGEEFIIGLPNCPKVMALEIAERIRGKIEGSIFHEDDTNGAIRVTASFGVTTVVGGGAPTHLDDIIKLADNALYEAKRKGRNTIVFVSSSEGADTLSRE